MVLSYENLALGNLVELWDRAGGGGGDFPKEGSLDKVECLLANRGHISGGGNSMRVPGSSPK